MIAWNVTMCDHVADQTEYVGAAECSGLVLRQSLILSETWCPFTQYVSTV